MFTLIGGFVFQVYKTHIRIMTKSSLLIKNLHLSPRLFCDFLIQGIQDRDELSEAGLIDQRLVFLKGFNFPLNLTVLSISLSC